MLVRTPEILPYKMSRRSVKLKKPAGAALQTQNGFDSAEFVLWRTTGVPLNHKKDGKRTEITTGLY